MVFKNKIKDEKSLFEELLKLTDYEEKAALVVKNILSCPNNIVAEKEKLKGIEREMDEVIFELKVSIVQGAINPSIIDNILNLIEKFDDNVDTIYFMSREINRYFLYLNSNYKNVEGICAFYSIINKMIDAHLKNINLIKKMLQSENETDFVSNWYKIIKIEEEMDDLKDNLLDEIYQKANRLDYLTYLHSVEIIHKGDDIIDTDRDISELIVNIIESIIK
ncbi:MAG: DUF47 family protein [Thermoplasmata archaeon]|jgi:uncharacterized protein Yka (UPF0111/DUF47 family)